LVFPVPDVPLINVERPIAGRLEGMSSNTLNARGKLLHQLGMKLDVGEHGADAIDGGWDRKGEIRPEILLAVSGMKYLGFVEWSWSIRSCSEAHPKKQIRPIITRSRDSRKITDDPSERGGREESWPGVGSRQEFCLLLLIEDFFSQSITLKCIDALELRFENVAECLEERAMEFGVLPAT